MTLILFAFIALVFICAFRISYSSEKLFSIESIGTNFFLLIFMIAHLLGASKLLDTWSIFLFTFFLLLVVFLLPKDKKIGFDSVRVLAAAVRRCWIQLFLVSMLFLFIGIVTYFLPIYTWDVLEYHTYPVMIWVKNSGFIYDHGVLGTKRASILPMGFEAMQALLGVLSVNDIPIKFLEFTAGLLGGVYLFKILREINGNNESHFVLHVNLALAYMLSPAVLIQLGASRNDLTTNSFFIGIILFGFRYLKSPSMVSIVYLGICFGMVLGIKPINIVPATFFVFIILACSYLYRDTKLKYLFRSAAWFGLISFSVGSFWYIKNLIIYRHPLPASAPASFKDGILDFSNFYKYLKGDVHRLFDVGATFTSDFGDGAGWGPQFFLLVISSLGFLLLSKSSIKRDLGFWACFVLYAFGIVYMVHQFSKNNPWNFRYFIWISTFPYLFTAFIANHIRQITAWSYFVFGISFAYGTITAHIPADANADVIRQNMAKDVCERSSAFTARYQPGQIRYIVENIPKELPVTYQRVRQARFIYSLVDPCWERPLSLCIFSDTVEKLSKCMEENGSKIVISSHVLKSKLVASRDFTQIFPGIFIKESSF